MEILVINCNLHNNLGLYFNDQSDDESLKRRLQYMEQGLAQGVVVIIGGLIVGVRFRKKKNAYISDTRGKIDIFVFKEI